MFTKNGSCGVPYHESCPEVWDDTLEDAHEEALDELWDLDLVCKASQCAFVVVWVSIFTASADRGVVPACNASGSKLWVSLSHRYTSPLW